MLLASGQARHLQSRFVVLTGGHKLIFSGLARGQARGQSSRDEVCKVCKFTPTFDGVVIELVMVPFAR